MEGCERKCRTPQKRRMHLIDKHMYPKNFFFAVTRDGIDGRRSMLLEGGHQRRRSSTTTMQTRRESIPESSKSGYREPETEPHMPASGSAPEPTSKADEQTSQQHPDVEMDDLVGAMSSLQFIPRGVRFGRGKGRIGFAKR